MVLLEKLQELVGMSPLSLVVILDNEGLAGFGRGLGRENCREQCEEKQKKSQFHR
jgi:hypothetical protein